MVHVNQYEESNEIDYAELFKDHAEDFEEETPWNNECVKRIFSVGDRQVKVTVEDKAGDIIEVERTVEFIRDYGWEVVEWGYDPMYAVWEYQGEPPESDQTIVEEFRSDLEDVQAEVGTRGIAGEPFNEVRESGKSELAVKCKGAHPDWDAIYDKYTYELAKRGWIMVGSDSQYNTFDFEKVVSIGVEEE